MNSGGHLKSLPSRSSNPTRLRSRTTWKSAGPRTRLSTTDARVAITRPRMFRKWASLHPWRVFLPERYLREHAWYHWKRRLHHDPDMPLATIAKHLKQIHPDLGHYPDENERRKLLVSSISL